MMRVVSLVLVCLLSAAVSAQEGDAEDQPKQEQKIPTTLAEAHAELERILSAETLAEIDALDSEGDMIKYHFGLGLNIRNGWGLWQGGPLAKYMRELGFDHPDIMSGVILGTFWCKRHGQDLRLEARAAGAKRSKEIQRKLEEEQENRAREGNAAIRNMMMGLRFEHRDVPVVQMRIGRGLNVRFSCPFRDGVFLTGYCQGSRGSATYTEGYYDGPADSEPRLKPEYDAAVSRGFWDDSPNGDLRTTKPGEDFYVQGWYFDPGDGKTHWINVPEVNNVYAAVVADDRAWFAGVTDGKPVLVGVGQQDRLTVPLPQADEIPDLGLDGQSLLAVYSKTIYCLADRTWTLVHSGDILLPRSGPPPQRHGNRVFLCDEGVVEGHKRLWWLMMGEKARLRLLARDTGLFEPIVRHGPDWTETHGVGPGGWEGTSSYCVTGDGDLWACVAYGSFLLRRSRDGTYSYAIADRSIQFAEAPPASEETEQGLSVSGVTALPDDTLLLVGYTGLYRLKGNELIQELAFAPQDSSGKAVGRGNWNPNNVLALGDRSYFISTSSWDGVYWLRPGDDGQWTCQSAGRGDPVVW